MGHVGQPIFELAFGKRTPRPVGEARGLVDLGVGDLARQGLVRRRFAEAADHRHDLGVEQGIGDDAAFMPENLDVLPPGMQHLDDARVLEKREKRRQVDAVRQRIDDGRDAGGGDLQQAEDRPIGRVAHELGVEGDIRRALDLVHQRRQIRRGLYDPHATVIADSGRKRLA